MARDRALGTRLEADDRDFQRTLDQVQRKVRDTAREMEGSLGRALGDTTRDLSRLGDKAPAVAAGMLRLEDAQQKYNRTLARHGEESRQARLALARVADQQDRVNQAADRARRSLDRANDQLERQGRASRLAGRGVNSLKLGLLGLGAAAGYTAVRGITASLNAASSLNEELAKSEVVFGRASADVIAFSETTADGLGISQRAALEASGTFGNMLVPMGLARGEAARMSVRMTTLAGDMASFNNASPEDTLLAIRSALAGEIEPLRRYGVALTQARIQNEALASGIAEEGEELSNAQKVRAAYNLILKDTRDQHGDASRTGEQFAGVQRRLSASVEDLQARIGRKLIPVVERVANRMLDNWPRIERATDSLTDAMGGFIDFMGNVVTGRWKKAWGQILSAVESSKGPLGRAANAVGREIARGVVDGFDAALASIPGSGAIRRFLGTGAAVDSADVQRVIGGGGLSTGYSGRGIASSGFATGGVIPGRYDARDDVTVRVSRGEAVINPLQIALLGGEENLNRVMAATGGRVGTTGGFATGGRIGDAYQRATSKLGTPYSYGRWDCSDYAYYVAGLSPWGTTASAFNNDSVPARGDEPVLWGLRKSHSSPGWIAGPKEHMGVGVLGPDGKRRWFDNGSGGVESNSDSARWQVLRVPKNWAGVTGGSGGFDTGSETRGVGSTPPGISAGEFRGAVTQARRAGEAGQASAPGLTDIASIDRRHSDDALQERVIRRRGGQDSDVYAFQKREVERDIKDVSRRIKNLVKRRDRLVKLTRQLVRQGSRQSTSRVARERALARFQEAARELTDTRDAIRTLQEMRRELVMDAKLLGFDIQDAQAEEAAEAADTADTAGEDATGGLSAGQETALRNLGAWAQNGEAFTRAVTGVGDIGAGGRTALAAAFNPAGVANITVQALHTGDPQVLRQLAETVTRALGTQGSVPATNLATGA